MTKKKAILGVIVLAVIAGAFVAFINVEMSGSATQEKEIAKIGNHTITESALREYVFLATEDTTMRDSGVTLETAAKEYAKVQIAAAEIAGTEYDISPEYRKELVAQENERSQSKLEEDTAYCAQKGITLEELTSAMVTSKMNIAIKQKHCQVFYDKLKETEKNQGKEVDHTAEELVSLYEEYMEKKVAEMKFVILDAERVKNVQGFLESSLETLEK